jgi:hypothetical protein
LPAIYQPQGYTPPAINITSSGSPAPAGANPAPTIAPQGFLANVDWGKWASIAAVVGTGVTLFFMLKGKKSRGSKSEALF